MALVEPRRLTSGGDDQDVVVALGERRPDQLVVVVEADRDDARLLQDRVVRLELGLLDHAVPRRQDEVAALAVVAGVEDLADLLVGLQREHVRDVATPGVASGLWQLVHLLAVHAALVGEEEQPVVRGGDEQVVDVVLVLDLRPAQALAAPPLRTVGGDREALDVATGRDGDDHLLVGDEVLDVDLALGGDDLRAPLVAEALPDVEELRRGSRRRPSPRRRGSPAAPRSCP